MALSSITSCVGRSLKVSSCCTIFLPRGSITPAVTCSGVAGCWVRLRILIFIIYLLDVFGRDSVTNHWVGELEVVCFHLDEVVRHCLGINGVDFSLMGVVPRVFKRGVAMDIVGMYRAQLASLWPASHVQLVGLLPVLGVKALEISSVAFWCYVVNHALSPVVCRLGHSLTVEYIIGNRGDNVNTVSKYFLYG